MSFFCAFNFIRLFLVLKLKTYVKILAKITLFFTLIATDKFTANCNLWIAVRFLVIYLLCFLSFRT